MRSEGRTSAVVAIVSALLIGSPLAAAGGEPLDGARRELALHKLGVLGSVLYIGAHPDDENTAMLAYFADGRLYRTAYLSLTRGAGGQNLIGTEQGPAMGVLRTEELLAARRIDGAEQYFTRAVDFGYSKSPEETLAIWGHDKVLADVVWVIRSFRPDIIVMRFPGTGAGGHGHHTASAILAKEAFTAAADPRRFPEQLEWVKPWQAKRLFWNAWHWGGRPSPKVPGVKGTVTVDVGAYNPLLGEAYTEIAGRSRSMHKSQGFGAPERRGTSPETLELLAGDAVSGDPMSGIDTTWNRIPRGGRVGELLAEASRRYDAARPEGVVPVLLEAIKAMDALPDDPWVALKRRAAATVVAACAGVWLDAAAPEGGVVPGEDVAVTATALCRSSLPVTLERVEPPFGAASEEVGAVLADNQPLVRELHAAVPAGEPYTQPYWLEQAPEGGTYAVSDPRQLLHPETPPPAHVTFTLDVDGTKLAYRVPVVYRWTDPVEGERSHPLDVVPLVTANLDQAVELFPRTDPRTVRVVLRCGGGEAAGTVRLELPEGWSSSPESVPFRLGGRGRELAVRFAVTPPRTEGTGTLRVVVDTGGREISRSLVRIDHPHIPVQLLLPPAEAKLVRADIAVDGRRIGYVMGPGDEVPEALRQLGYQVTLLSDDDLDGGEFSAFDAVVTGVRAFNTRPALARDMPRLLAWVEQGGTLVVQYNNNRGLVTDRLGPYPLKLSRDRVTVEGAPVTFLAPDSPLLTTPNRITEAAFSGWVQERGLYYPDSWDPRYQAVLAMADPGEKPLDGALLFTRYGKGATVYTGLSFFRQLPAGVPGAYRLFANLLAGGEGRD